MAVSMLTVIKVIAMMVSRTGREITSILNTYSLLALL